MIDTSTFKTIWLNYQAIGLVAGATMLVALFPRYWMLMRTKDLSSTPATKLLLLVIGSLLWIMYGFRDSSPAVVLFAAVSFAITSILLLIKLRSA